MPFTFTPTNLPEVIKIKAKAFPDSRGMFAEMYKASEFKANGITLDFIQDNLAISKKGVIRGLHYQLPPYTQGKLIMAIEGAVWDVIVDIRNGSPTFGKWVAEELSEENRTMLFLPPGFAHGFLALSDARVIYKMTSAEYAPSFDRGVLYNDPGLNIPWPIDNPILSDKDLALPKLKDIEPLS
jgi:dTDP-4-dehydrorhamnose 3,5-epimerase